MTVPAEQGEQDGREREAAPDRLGGQPAPDDEDDQPGGDAGRDADEQDEADRPGERDIADLVAVLRERSARVGVRDARSAHDEPRSEAGDDDPDDEPGGQAACERADQRARRQPSAPDGPRAVAQHVPTDSRAREGRQ